MHPLIRYCQPLVLVLVLVLAMLCVTAYGQAPGDETTPPATEGQQPNQRQAEEVANFADGLFRRGLYRMAAAEYERLIQQHPSFERTPQAYPLLAESYRKLDQPDKAVAIYQQLLETYPTHEIKPRALVNLIELLVDLKRYDQAIATLNTYPLEQLPPAAREALAYYRGQVYSQQKAFDKALDSYRLLPRNEFDEAYPYRPYAQLASALILQARDNAEQAKPLLRGLASAESLPSTIRQEALYKLGDLAFTQSQYQDAITALSDLIERFPEGPYTNLAIITTGWSLLQLERYRELLALFEEAESSQLTRTGEEFYLRGTAAKELKLYEAALNSFQHLLQHYPDSDFRPYATVGMVECLYFLGRYQECVAAGEAALEANPNHPFAMEIYQFLGQAYLSLKEWQKVASTYEGLLEHHGDELNQKGDFLFLLADAYEQYESYEQAAATYRRALDLDRPELAVEALLLAAENEMSAKRYEEAFQDYQRILNDYSDSPKVAVALVGMAECMTYLDQTQRAIDLLNRFLQHYTDHPERGNALYLRGTLYFRLQRTKEAIADLASSLKEPNFAEKDYARLFLAYALWEEGKENEALQLFVDLLQKEDIATNFAPSVLKQIGRRYLQKNNITAAEKAFQLLVEHGSEEDRLSGQIGLGRTAFMRGEYEKANELFSEIKEAAKPGSEQQVIALAYLGETFRLLGQTDRALLAFQDGLSIGTTDVNSNALLRVGLAKIFYRQKKLDQALRYATSAFLLFDDPQHSPEGMLLAIRILSESDRQEEASIAYAELANRFPIALARFKQSAENAQLFEKLD